MKPLKWLAAALLWVLASLVGLVGVLLCVTVILLPVGLLLISLSRRLYRLAGRLVVPRPIRHPVSELGSLGADASGSVAKTMHKTAKRARKKGRAATKRLPDRKRRVLGVTV